MAVILVCMAMALAAGEATDSGRVRPNILLIVADDLGFGDLGCYGQRDIRTPNLDRLASEGMRFTGMYAGSADCVASRAALMTGLHTGHCRIRGRGSGALGPGDLTVSEVLKEAGYQTVALGEWELGSLNSTGTPLRKGFYDWYGFLEPGDLRREFPLALCEDYYPPFFWRDEVVLFEAANAWGRKTLYAPHKFYEVAHRFLEQNTDRAFFLYFASPLPRPNLAVRNLEVLPLLIPGLVALTPVPIDGSGNLSRQVPSDLPYHTEPWPQAERNKAAMISLLDRYVGGLMAELTQLHLETNTIVIFTSDNGPHCKDGVDAAFFHSAGPLRGAKGQLFEGGIRVPMIVRWPGKVPAGRVSGQIWASWDLLPTLAEIARVGPVQGVDGISMLPALLGQKQKEHEYLYWELQGDEFQQAVRLGEWKALRLATGQPLKLYNLAEDPGEKVDLADRYPEITANLQALLTAAHTPSLDWPAPVDH